MKKFVYGTMILMLFFFSAQVLGQGNISMDNQNYVADQVIIKFKPSTVNLQKSSGITSMQNFASDENLTPQENIPTQNITIMKIENGQNVMSVIQDLQNNPSVEYSQPNFIYHIQMTTNDTYFTNQRWLKNIWQNWGISGDDIQRSEAMDIWSWDGNQNTTGTIVAVIDNGLRYTHPDFAGQLWDWSNCRDSQNIWTGWCTYGFDTFNGGSAAPYGDKDPLPNGTDSHGTHIAGIIWAKTNNGMGIAGINPWAKIMAIRAGSWTDLYTDDIINAINFAKYNGAKIINASRWGVVSTCMDLSGYRDQLLYTTIKNFPWLFITAAGNWYNGVGQQHLNNRYVAPADYNTTTSCRSGLDNIIAVAATDNTDTKATFSDYWSNINIAAPGVNILSTVLSNNYGRMDGTSMATPFVAAVASLARSMRPELSYLDIKNAIIDQAEYVGLLSGYVAGGKRLNAYTTLYALSSIATWSITFLSWSITNSTWVYIRLATSKTGTYTMSGVWMVGLLTWTISLTWVDVLISLTPWDEVKNVAVVFFDSVAKPSQAYTTGIILDTTAPTVPVVISPISWTIISWIVNLLWNTSLDTWWMSGYYYEVSNDSGLNSMIMTWVVYTTWVSVNLFSWNTYYRRLRAFDMLGKNSNFSETWSFVLLRDSWPEVFTFTAIGGAELTTEYISNQISISWINTGTTISIIWGTYQINATGNFISTTWIVYSWDTVKTKLTSSVVYESTTTSTLNIWGITSDFIVTTKSAPSGWWGGWGWGGWWWIAAPSIPTCILSQLICSWWIYLTKSWVSCEWWNLDKSCGTITWTVLSGKILSGTIPKYTTFTTNNNWWFSAELIKAYNYAHEIGITTISTIQQANMTGTLIRKHLAKMISNFAIKQMKRIPNTWLVCNFIDMSDETTEIQFYSKLACQLGLMGVDGTGIPTKVFNPNDEVTRAQFGTVLSRTLRGNQYNGGQPFYIFHLDALEKAHIMQQIDTPGNKELRGYVMLMLMRSVE